MYEEATVLDYKGRKLWIKHVVGPLYCVNGRYIAFNPKQDLEDVSVISEGIDEWYSPFYADLDDDGVVVFGNHSNESDKFIMSASYLARFQCDPDMVKKLETEYEQWMETIDAGTIYINDYRNADMDSWLMGQLNKEGDM